jgi:xylan 1,4-beta-xylosidase
MDRRQFVSSVAALGSLSLAGASVPANAAAQHITVDPTRKTGAFPHYWAACAGSGHARLALQARWQKDLELAHRGAGIQAVRFHGLLDDDLAVCPNIGVNGPITNFLFVDEIYDRLLDIGVRPYVELSFMPRALASSDNEVFWYHGNTSPPKRMSDWSALMRALARHLVDRYGLGEVAQWRFECWNEPNLSFWAGTQSQYFDFYRHTAEAIKSVDQRLQVGGPATAQMMWIPEFLAYCARNRVPVDFVSSHIYPGDPQENVFGRRLGLPAAEVMPRALRQANEQIHASAFPDLPLVISEWSSTDPAFIAQMVRDCAGLADTMSYWTFSNVFEEQGPNRHFINDTYGLIGTRGVPRPTFRTFELLHRLGDHRISAGEGPVLATRHADGKMAIMAWHLPPASAGNSSGNPVLKPTSEIQSRGPALTVQVKLSGVAQTSGQLTVVDPADDPVMHAYAEMGSPPYPSVQQIREMRSAGALKSPREIWLQDGRLDLSLPPSAVALIEIG